jgi:hypothetical protein
MRRRLIVAVFVLMAGVVGIDEMNVVDASCQLPDQLNLVGKRFFLALLARSDDSYHLAMAGVVLQSEVRLVDGVVDAYHVAGLVESEPGLKFPSHVLAVVRRDVAAGLPCLHNAIHGSLVIDLPVDGGRLNAVHSNALNAYVTSELRVAFELGNVLALLSSIRCDFSGIAPGQFSSGPLGLPGFGCGGKAPNSTPSKPSPFKVSHTVTKSIGLFA